MTLPSAMPCRFPRAEKWHSKIGFPVSSTGAAHLVPHGYSTVSVAILLSVDAPVSVLRLERGWLAPVSVLRLELTGPAVRWSAGETAIRHRLHQRNRVAV
jgi:hypothetical protein